MSSISKSFKGHFIKSSSPFEDTQFYQLLESSNLLTQKTGWSILNHSHDQSLLPGFIKTHSYGEYIFDWEWANFFHKNGFEYYPKLVHTTPFTPVNSEKIIGGFKPELFKKSFEFYERSHNLNSEHYLFINQEEQLELEKLGFCTMHTLQYHFKNEWSSFEDFLLSLKKNKRKNIRKERKLVSSYDIEIEWLKSCELTDENLSKIYLLYLSTIAKKQSQAYLNEDFFLGLKNYSEQKLKILVAKKNDEIIAMSLFFLSANTLYGRYWGIHPNFEQEFKYLHFEMCYYHGMIYTIENKLDLFEAGAQGEQKLLRGFKPVLIRSAHHMKNQLLFKAIKDYIKRFNHHTLNQKIYLEKHLPYRDAKNEKA